MVEVLELIAVPGRRTASMRLYSDCFRSSRSMIASTTQSHSAMRSRWSSILPVSTSLAAALDMNGAGSVLSIFSTAPLATASRSASPGLTMSSSSTGVPLLATWAAMPAPITPAPMTQTFLIGSAMTQTASSRVAMPWPPPMHWVARAYLPPSRFSSEAALPTMRAPVAPSG